MVEPVVLHNIYIGAMVCGGITATIVIGHYALEVAVAVTEWINRGLEGAVE